MRKTLLAILFAGAIGTVKAQYGTMDQILTRLEERSGVNQNLESVNIDDKKFVFIKDEADHTERDFIIIQGNQATGKSTSNVFSGDIIRKKNIISLRADMLENKKVPIPLTKTLLLTKQDNILYLIDVNTKTRWIDEAALSANKSKNKSKK
jgi:hypothetical protein